MTRPLLLALLLVTATSCREGPGLFEPREREIEGDSRKLTFNTDREFEPVWSPDGNSIYYSTADFPDRPDLARTLVRVSLDGGRARLVAPAAQGGSGGGAGSPPLTFPVPSPDGSRLAYVELACRWVSGQMPRYPCVGGSAVVRAVLRVRRADATGRASADPGVEIMENSAGIDPNSLPFRPTWSPDGSRVAFADGVQLRVWDLSGNAPVPVPGTAGARAAAWHPETDEIAFVSGGEIHVVNLATEELRSVIGGGDPAWSPDGAEILFTGMGGIQRVPAAGGAASEVAWTAGGRAPAVSPNGEWVAFTRTKPIDGSTDHDVWVVRLDPG